MCIVLLLNDEKMLTHLSKTPTSSENLLCFGYCFKNTKPSGFWVQVQKECVMRDKPDTVVYVR
jgi:hypothetical protein